MYKKAEFVFSGLCLFILSVKIDFYNRLLTGLLSKRRLLSLACIADRRLETQRKEFLLLEKRHSCIIKSEIP